MCAIVRVELDSTATQDSIRVEFGFDMFDLWPWLIDCCDCDWLLLGHVSEVMIVDFAQTARHKNSPLDWFPQIMTWRLWRNAQDWRGLVGGSVTLIDNFTDLSWDLVYGVWYLVPGIGNEVWGARCGIGVRAWLCCNLQPGEMQPKYSCTSIAGTNQQCIDTENGSFQLRFQFRSIQHCKKNWHLYKNINYKFTILNYILFVYWKSA